MTILWNYKIDWSATGNMLSGIGSICAAIAVVWAANKAADTYSAWRRQKIAERKIDQAERILTATYKAQYALAYVRGRLIMAHELAEAEKTLSGMEGFASATSERSKNLIAAQVYFERLQKCANEKKILLETLPIARALWGKDLEEALVNLNRQFWLIQTYADESIDIHLDDDKERRRKVWQALGASPEDTDEISTNILTCVGQVESHCLPVLQADTKV